jgi:hypothetical protein
VKLRALGLAMTLLWHLTCGMLTTWPLTARAAVPASPAQRKMAVGLAVAHLRAEIRKYPQAALPGLDFDHPQVLARSAAAGRQLVFVSFESKLARWGQYVTFELCAHSSRIERVDSGRISDVALYRAMVATINETTPSRLPSGCRSARG